MRGLALVAIFATLALSVTAQDEYKVVCYVSSWSIYRPGNGHFDLLNNIDTKLCTHFIYAFAGITTTGDVLVLDAWSDLPSGLDGFRKFTGLKSQNPSAKFMIAMGGWNENSKKYSDVMNQPALRTTFIGNVIKFMKLYGFDGFDLDWEYPCQRGGQPYDMVNYVLLLEEMRSRFDEEGFVLSAGVAAAANLVDLSYDVPNVSKHLHFMNIMTYDFHGPWEPFTGQNSPLYASSKDETDFQKTLNVDAAVSYWIERGADPAKIVVGMSANGHSYTLSTADASLGAPISGPAPGGPYTQNPGSLGFMEICEKQTAGGWTVTWDNEQKVPFAVKDREWVGYDNVKSITEKVEYVKAKGLAGGMLWTLETDDFRNVCGDGKYPLLTAMQLGFSEIPTESP